MVRRYQGALVELFNIGVFLQHIIKLDLKSQYPSIMIVLNLSPESLKLQEVKPYTGKYVITPTLIEVPDENIGQVVIQISEEDSITRIMMLEFAEQRAKYRLIDDKEHESMQLAVKIIMNAMYGYNGMEYSRYGNFLVAIVTTAIGRLMMQTMIDTCRTENITLIEADTDGLFVQTDRPDAVELMNTKVKNIFDGFKYKDVIKVDADKYNGMISVMMKNYVLLTEKNDIIFKGAGFKGRHIPAICDYILDDIATAIFGNTSRFEVWNKYKNLKKYPLDNFSMTVELKTDPSRYANKTSLYSKLSRKVENVEWGDEIRYVKTIEGYIPLGYMPDEDLHRILDYGYYRKRMIKMVKRISDVLEPKQVKLI